MTHKSLTPEQQTIRDLSERIVEAQKPIRILDAVKWPQEIKKTFFKHKAKQLPAIKAGYYQNNPLTFDPNTKRAEFYEIEHDIKCLLGRYNDIGQIMLRMCREYRTVIRLIEQRGTPEFGRISQELYGTTDEVLYAGAPTLRELTNTLHLALTQQEQAIEKEQETKTITAAAAVKKLQKRLGSYFHGSATQVHVQISDGIIADAAAGADTLKLRGNAKFSERDLKSLEVHEGWVHIATTLNGNAQPICTYLSKGPPSSTITQEGLAIIMELFTFSSTPSRVLRLTNRVKAIDLATSGANFLEVYQFFLEQNCDPEHAYSDASRVFRGSTSDGLPFTKDLAYIKGFIAIYNYVRLAIRFGAQKQIPLLFLGKTSLEDIHVYSQLLEDGTIIAPPFIPPQFADLTALTAWMIYSLFLNEISLERLSLDYRKYLQI